MLNINLGDDAAEGAVVERRGRFKVTSVDVSLKVSIFSNPVRFTVLVK